LLHVGNLTLERGSGHLNALPASRWHGS
jgi:hypothetical protein